MKTPGDGFNGTAGTTWDGDALMMKDRLKGGQQCDGMSRRLKTTAAKVTWAADANSDKLCSIGLTIHETYEHRCEQTQNA
jgi:hypothetical protein